MSESNTVGSNKVVTIHYTLRSDDGEVLDTSDGGEPLSYLHGAGNIVPGLEAQLEGRSEGDKLVAVVAPKDGYGERDPASRQSIPLAAFEGVDVKAGMTLVVEDDDGEQMPLHIVAVHADHVEVDTEHPLAGATLHFTVEVVGVREATAEELLHGHVHGEGDHHHHH
jgi:FKBP-type peptidyl-prolyl cis-trans isomerase SlyD